MSAIVSNGFKSGFKFPLSMIASKLTAKGGGVYYMISRSLGKEFGGSVGILLYLSTTAGVAIYILGAVEVLIVNMSLFFSFFLLIYNSFLLILILSRLNDSTFQTPF
jgi:amino acid transporter